MGEDNACEIINEEPDVKLCIYANDSLTKQNCELLRNATETATKKQYLYNMKKVINYN